MNKKKIYTLSYSNVLTPPPFLYQLNLGLELNEKGVLVKYSKQFINREDFTEEELEEEGFSLNDDFQLEQQLTLVWKGYFEDLLASGQWTKEFTSETQPFISLQTPLSAEKSYLLFPQAEYQMEEIYQAILETSNQEAPLSVHIRQANKDKTLSYECIWRFKDRQFEISSNQNIKARSWQEGRNLLHHFYETDLSELPVHKKNLPEGKWCIDPGDGLWYELPENSNSINFNDLFKA